MVIKEGSAVVQSLGFLCCGLLAIHLFRMYIFSLFFERITTSQHLSTNLFSVAGSVVQKIGRGILLPGNP